MYPNNPHNPNAPVQGTHYQQQANPQQANPAQATPKLEEQFKAEGWETIANGDSYPTLKSGTTPDCEILPGENIVAKILNVFHGTSSYKKGPLKAYTGLVLEILQVKQNTALTNQRRCFFLKGTYRNDFIAAQWGVNDYISVGYGGQQEPGVKNSKHLYYIQGKRNENLSRFVPVPESVKRVEEAGDVGENRPQTNFPEYNVTDAPPRAITAPTPTNPVGPVRTGLAVTPGLATPQNPTWNQPQVSTNPGVPTFN